MPVPPQYSYSRTCFLNPGIRDWRISNPGMAGIPAGLWDPVDMISKTVIFEYMGLNLRFLSQRHRPIHLN